MSSWVAIRLIQTLTVLTHSDTRDCKGEQEWSLHLWFCMLSIVSKRMSKCMVELSFQFAIPFSQCGTSDLTTHRRTLLTFNALQKLNWQNLRTRKQKESCTRCESRCEDSDVKQLNSDPTGQAVWCMQKMQCHAQKFADTLSWAQIWVWQLHLCLRIA